MEQPARSTWQEYGRCRGQTPVAAASVSPPRRGVSLRLSRSSPQRGLGRAYAAQLQPIFSSVFNAWAAAGARAQPHAVGGAAAAGAATHQQLRKGLHGQVDILGGVQQEGAAHDGDKAAGLGEQLQGGRRREGGSAGAQGHLVLGATRGHKAPRLPARHRNALPACSLDPPGPPAARSAPPAS